MISAVALSLLLASPTADPKIAPPIIEYTPPATASVHGSYVCASKRVSIQIRAQSGSVEVVSYKGSAGAATADQLRHWNQALARFGSMTGLEFLCQDGQNELIRITGIPKDPGDKRTWQNVFWSGGRFGVL